MTLVKFKNRPVDPRFNNLMDDFFPAFPSLFRDEMTSSHFRHAAPLNIKETEISYELEVIAPGFQKEDFKIDLENNILTVSLDKKTEGEEKSEKFIRSEYKYQGFKRSFTLDEKVDAESISAQYVNGVLVLNLPKKAEVKPQTKQITIQ